MAEILLIDDDRSIHQIVSLFLEDAGHQVHSAITGPAGIELASLARRPDLILLDVAMPGMDGIETLQALKDDRYTAEIPVMLFTVHDRELLDGDFLNNGLVGYLKKPVNMEALRASVDLALSHPQLLH